MAIDEKRALCIQLRSILQTIKERSGDKGEQVTVDMAKHYNHIRANVGKMAPGIASYLPPDISLKGDFVPMGLTDSTKFDLQTYVNNILALLDE